jgi:hypothetical protein
VKVLFDECIPRPLRTRFHEFEVRTAQEMGWGRLKNGELLERAEGVFDAFLTADKNLKYQQNIADRRLAILRLPTNHWPTLKPQARRIAKAVAELKPGDYVELEF